MSSRLLLSSCCVSLVLWALLAGPAAAQVEVVTVSDQAALVEGAFVTTTITMPAPKSAPPVRAIPQLAGWPKIIGGNGTFAPTRGLVFADLDGDGPLEIIVSSTDKNLYAFDVAGNAKPGFPVLLNNYAQTAPSVADIDHDGDLEIVQFTRGLTNGGSVYVLDHQGIPLPGYPLSFNNNNLAGAPTLYDLDGDGQLEILVPERSYPIGYLHVLELNGTTWGGNWPAVLDHVPTGSPAVADLDRDGVLEIVYLSYNSIFVFDVTGKVESGWPKQIANANFSYQSPALADLDGDGDLEIVVGAHKTAAGTYVFNHDGSSFPGWPQSFGSWSYCPPTVTDLNGDQQYEIISGQDGSVSPPSNSFWAWTTAGAPLAGFPYVSSNGGGCGGPFTAGDVDNNGLVELFADCNMMVSGQGFLYGVDPTGTDLASFPLRPVGFTYMNGAAIGDVDGDGDAELGVLSHHDAVVEVNLYDLSGAFLPGKTPWPTYHVRYARGGLEGSGDRLHLLGSVALGGACTLHVTGKPADLSGLFLGIATGAVKSPAFGWFYLAGAPLPIFVGLPIPATGDLPLPAVVPNTPALIGLSFYLQGITGTAAAASFTNLVGKTIP